MYRGLTQQRTHCVSAVLAAEGEKEGKEAEIVAIQLVVHRVQ